MTKVKILHTKGQGAFEEGEFEVPDIKDNQIRVKSVFTGVCRSDIDMMNGNLVHCHFICRDMKDWEKY